MKRPAIRIVLAPLQRHKDKGMKKLYGMQMGRTIYIDPRTKNPISTFKHELIHLKHPSWTEKEVEAAEEQWWKRSTWREKAELLQLLAHAEIKEPGEVIRAIDS